MPASVDCLSRQHLARSLRYGLLRSKLERPGGALMLLGDRTSEVECHEFTPPAPVSLDLLRGFRAVAGPEALQIYLAAPRGRLAHHH